MNAWIIVSVVLALGCAGLTVACVRLNGRLKERLTQEFDLDSAQSELYELRGEVGRRRREIAALHRELEDEQDRSDAFEEAYEKQKQFSDKLKRRIEQADARWTEAEKSVYAGRMRIQLLEDQIRSLEREQLAQEQLYQDILREREETLARLQEQQKKRTRKKSEAPAAQITFDDLLSGL